MADISDITTYLKGAALAAVYPNGTSQPSVAAMDVRVIEGWPEPQLLDLDMAGKTLIGATGNIPIPRPGGLCATVSVFPMLGMSVTPYQIQDDTLVISQPTYGLTASVTNGVINVSGTPASGEYLTVITDRAYAYSASGASAAAIIATLAASFANNYIGVSSTASSLTIPYGFALTIRQGGQGTLGKVVHRQRQGVMVSVWAPNHGVRAVLAAAIDVALKSQITITLPDTSQAIIVYSRTNVIDDKQVATIYRRDLIYDVEYATVQQFKGFVITTVNESIGNYSNSSTAPALT
jgi:hypothetical protein